MIFECDQGGAEWAELHRGVPTSSSFDKILTAKTMKLSAQCDDLICDLIAQRAYLGSMLDYFGSKPMTRTMQYGKDTEAEARHWYELDHGCDVRQVGFCIDDANRCGCSPDGLIGEDGGLELKCPELKTHVRYILHPTELVSDYVAQVHGSLIVTGREWWDIMSYAPGLRPVVVRVTPNEYTESLRKALDLFWTRYQNFAAQVLTPTDTPIAAQLEGTR